MSDISPGELASFTSWKLDLLDALSCDPDVTDADFRVAFRLLQHVNSGSRIAWPSMDRLACQIGKSNDRIRAAIKSLSDIGWLKKFRPNRLRPNEYTFLDNRISGVLDGRLVREDALKEKLANRREASVDHAYSHGPEFDDHANPHGLDRVEMPCPDHANPHGKHLKENYLNRTPQDSGSEIGDSQYALASGRVAA